MILPKLFRTRERLVVGLTLALAFLVCFLLYVPGLSGEFIFDDSLNIVLNRAVHMQNLSWEEIGAAFQSGIASDMGRPLAMLSFAFNHLATGLDSFYFKLTNIVIHLLVALAIYFLSCELLSIKAAQKQGFRVPYKVVALVITAAWTLHPLQVSTVLYIVQRMTELSALMSVLALIVYCRLRRQAALSDIRIALSHAAIGVLIVTGILFKENAALTVLYIAAIEFALFAGASRTREQRRFVYSFFAIFLVIPATGALIFLLMEPDYILRPYAVRSFTLAERLLTEPRVIWDYVRWVLVPDTREFSLYHENYPISSALFAPPVTAFALLGLTGLCAAVVYLRKRLPWLSFGIAFFLAGHVLEGSIIALELVFEHRNYLPAYGLLFALFATLFSTTSELLSPRLVGGFSALVFLLFMSSTYGETRKWSSTPAHILGIYRYTPDSPRINYSMGSLYSRLGSVQQDMSYVREAQKYYGRMMELAPESVIPFAAYIRTASWLGEQPPPAIREKFLTNVRQTRFIPGETLELVSLISCFYSGTCANLGPLIVDVYQAIGDTAVMTPIQQQRLLDEIALSLMLRFQRVNDALALYYFAESLSPELSLVDIKIIMLELDRNQPAAARSHLDKSRRKAPTESAYIDALDDLEESITAFEANPPNAPQ